MFLNNSGKLNWANWIGIYCVLVLGMICNGSLHAKQVLSPNSTPLADPQKDPKNAGQGGDANIEPSKKLVFAIDKMTPYDIAGSEMEAGYIDAARSFLTGSTEESIKKLDEIAAKRKDAPPTPLLMATMLYAAGQNQQGRLWLEKTVSDFPDHPSAFIGFARFSAADKRIADAEAMLEKIDRLTKQGTWTEEQSRMFRMEYLDVLTDVSVNQQKLDQAKECLLELEKILPDNNRIPIRLAQVEFDLENIDSSLRYLRKAKEMSPKLRVPEVVMADWFLKKKKVKESEEWMLKAAAANPKNADVQLDYAQWLLENEKLEDAFRAVSKAETLDANDYVVGYLKGQIAFARRAYNIAEKHFEDLVKNKPRDADANNMLALSLIESGAPEKLSRALELSVVNQRIYPRSPTALATVGWAYYRNGKVAEAESAFRQLIQANSLDPASAFFVSSFLEKKGDLAGAKRLLDQSLNTDKYFMFRAAATELLKSVNDRISRQQPAGAAATKSGAPEKAGSGKKSGKQ